MENRYNGLMNKIQTTLLNLLGAMLGHLNILLGQRGSLRGTFGPTLASLLPFTPFWLREKFTEPAEPTFTEDGVDAEFAQQVREFMAEYRTALVALAR